MTGYVADLSWKSGARTIEKLDRLRSTMAVNVLIQFLIFNFFFSPIFSIHFVFTTGSQWRHWFSEMLLNLLMIVFWCRNWIHPSVFSMQGQLIACQQLVLVWTCLNYQSLEKKSFWETNCCMLFRQVLVSNWAK